MFSCKEMYLRSSLWILCSFQRVSYNLEEKNHSPAVLHLTRKQWSSKMQGHLMKQKQVSFSREGAKGFGHRGFMQQNPVRRCGRPISSAGRLLSYSLDLEILCKISFSMCHFHLALPTSCSIAPKASGLHGLLAV